MEYSEFSKLFDYAKSAATLEEFIDTVSYQRWMLKCENSEIVSRLKLFYKIISKGVKALAAIADMDIDRFKQVYRVDDNDNECVMLPITYIILEKYEKEFASNYKQITVYKFENPFVNHF